jgi:ketosteroid isomerase-like protein
MKAIAAAILLSTALLLSSALAGGAARADAVSAVLDHHVANMKSGSLDGVLADYAPDAVVVTPAGMVTPSGVFAGKDVRKLFSVLTDKDHVPGNRTMQTRYEKVSPDTTIMHWVQFKGSKQEVSGQDVFVVRAGKVVFQSVAVNPPK